MAFTRDPSLMLWRLTAKLRQPSTFENGIGDDHQEEQDEGAPNAHSGFVPFFFCELYL